MDADEGLGTSLLVYIGALLCVLGLIVVPVYYANQPTVIDNADSATVHESLVARSDSFPLAVLQHEDIVTPATLASLNAKPQHAAAAPRRTARAHTENSMARLTPEQPPRPFFPFSLF
jgi:hypothetical protein